MARYVTRVSTAMAPADVVAYLMGALRVFDLGLRLVFDRIGDEAARGFRRQLVGQQVPA